jgi:hypothetical protein
MSGGRASTGSSTKIYAARTGGAAIYRANDRRERLMRSQLAEGW